MFHREPRVAHLGPIHAGKRSAGGLRCEKIHLSPLFSSLPAGLDIPESRERATLTASRVIPVKKYGFK